MPIISYTWPALVLGNPAGYWASEAGAAVQPNIKLAPRLAHFEEPPLKTKPEDPYVEIHEVPTPPGSQYNEIVIRLHDDIEEFNLDIQKILDQIPEEIKGKNLSVKLSLERPVSPTRPEIPVGPDPEPESTAAEPEPTPAEEDPAVPPKTRLTFALPKHRKPHPAEHNWVYLGQAPPSTIESVNAELQRTAMQIGIINAEVEEAWLKAEEERLAAEAGGGKQSSTEQIRTAQSGPLPKPQLWLDIEYEGLQTPNLVRAILPPDFWERNEETASKAKTAIGRKNRKKEAAVPVPVPDVVEEWPYGPEDELKYLRGRPVVPYTPSERVFDSKEAWNEALVEVKAIYERKVGPLPEDWLEKKGEAGDFKEGYEKIVKLYKVIEGDLWKKLTPQ